MLCLSAARQETIKIMAGKVNPGRLLGSIQCSHTPSNVIIITAAVTPPMIDLWGNNARVELSLARPREL